MASLKEVRGRITSVTSTRKITSAMKLVSAAKLRRAQDAIASYLPYRQKITRILGNLVQSGASVELPLTQQREVKRVALVAISSNGSLCGAFNSNIIKKVDELLRTYSHLPAEDIRFYPLGKKMADAAAKKKCTVQGKYEEIVDKPDYAAIAAIADELMRLFQSGEIDRVELVYNHFKNAAVQQVYCEQLLPLTPAEKTKTDTEASGNADYILEPDANYLIQRLVPQSVRLSLFSALLDSVAAEHGARTTAMQIATDNAGELIQELKLTYNKARQEAITNEILDIVGGAEGLR